MTGDVAMREIALRWNAGILRSGWEVLSSSGGSERYLFGRLRLRKLRRGLYASGTVRRFDRALRSSEDFYGWWRESQGSEEAVYTLDFSEGGWDLPWELLLEHRLPSNRGKTSIIRRSCPPIAEKPTTFRTPLRILILQGGSKGLDLQRELDQIEEVYASLPLGARVRIEPIKHVSAYRHSLAEHLRSVQPHVLWFSGQGESRPISRLQMADETWLDVQEFARCVRDSGSVPLYAVFLACSTAAFSGNGPLPVAPDLIQALHDLGVMTVLAMQAPISDVGAALIARELFRGLAAGLPIEQSMPRVRADLYDRPVEGLLPFDWAAGVVWAAARAAEQLNWAVDSRIPAQLQLFGSRTFTGPAANASLLTGTSSKTEGRLTDFLRSGARTWLVGSPSELQHRAAWLGALRLAARDAEHAVFAVECGEERTEMGLRMWARGIMRPTGSLNYSTRSRARPLPGGHGCASRKTCCLRSIRRRAMTCRGFGIHSWPAQHRSQFSLPYRLRDNCHSPGRSMT